MVFVGDHSFGNVGTGETDGRNAYVLRGNGLYSGSVNQPGGQVTIQNATFYGTWWSRVTARTTAAANRDIKLKNNGTMTTARRPRR